LPEKIEFNFTKNYNLITDFLNNNFSSPTHYPDWNLIISEDFATDFFYHVCLKNGNIIGICPYHRSKNNSYYDNYSGPQIYLIPYGGWIFSEKIVLDLKQSNNGNFKSIQGCTLPLIPEFNVNYKFTNHTDSETLVVDLYKSEEEIWNHDVSSKRRNMIRKSMLNNIEVESIDVNDIDRFYEFYCDANNRISLQIFPKKYFYDLFTKSINIKFEFLVSKINNIPYSGIVIAYDKNYAIYWLGMTRGEIQNLGFGEVLQWEAIKFAKKSGCRYYDLSTIEKISLPQIYKFKKGFSKTETPFYFYSEKKLINKIHKRLFGTKN